MRASGVTVKPASRPSVIAASTASRAASGIDPRTTSGVVVSPSFGASRAW